MSAFHFVDDKIIDIGMPSDAKTNNTAEIRNLGTVNSLLVDFDADDMCTYEDIKGNVFVKNWYSREIEQIDDIKYFIDKWCKTQADPKADKVKSKFEAFKRARKTADEPTLKDKVKTELAFGHTVFVLNIRKNLTTSRLYLVSWAPYHFDLSQYEDQDAVTYKGKVSM